MSAHEHAAAALAAGYGRSLELVLGACLATALEERAAAIAALRPAEPLVRRLTELVETAALGGPADLAAINAALTELCRVLAAAVERT